MSEINNNSLLQENILASMSNGVLALDFEGKIITFNNALSTLLKIDREEAIGKAFPEVFFELTQNHDFNDVMINAVFSEETQFYKEVTFTRKDSTSIPIGLTCSYLKDETGKDIGVVTVINDLSESKKSKFLQDTLTRYVTKQVVDLIIDKPESINLEGEERESTILFADIRGFTTISESMDPKELVLMLRDYFNLMVGAVFKYEGTLDKFIGDCIMALFGAPVSNENHADQAVRAALEMRTLLGQFNEIRIKKSQTPIEIGIGIATGKVIVGNIGSHERFEYTAIGDTVNLASRMEGINKAYKTKILVSDSSHKLLSDNILVREIDFLKVKGKNKPVTIFEVIDLKDNVAPEMLKAVHKHQEALEYYKAKQWDDALALFKNFLKDNPFDEVWHIYQNRCELFKLYPPTNEWDRVWEIDYK